MNWILIGTLLGSIVTSTHESREACEGRLVLLKEKGLIGKCVEAPITPWSGVTPLNSNIIEVR